MKTLASVCCLGFALAATSPADVEPVRFGTYSIVAYDPQTGDLGVAVQSRVLGVGVVVPFAEAGVGAVATQSFANTSYGPRGLRLLKRGLSPKQVVARLTRKDPDRALRQVGVVDAKGRSHTFTGEDCYAWKGSRHGPNYAVQGNILAGEAVVAGMEQAFLQAKGSLAERMLAALEAAEAAGGDKRGKQSAALLVVRAEGGYGGFDDRHVDLRVDDSQDPVVELRRLFGLWQQTFGVGAHFRAAERFAKAGRKQAAQAERGRAVAVLERMLAAKPDDPETMNQVAWELASHDLKLDRALELAQRAVKLAPDEGHILDTLAEVHFRRGEVDKAIEIETKLVDKEPDNPGYAASLERFKAARP